MKISKFLASIATATTLAFSTSQAALLAYYSFDVDTGDNSGNGIHATSSSGITSTTDGYRGAAFDFSGTSSFIRIPLDINPAALPQLTMGAWVKASSVTPIKTVISHDNGFFDRTINIDTRDGSGWSTFAGNQSVLGNFTATLDVWSFVAAVYDQTATTTRLYVNGNSISRENTTLGIGNTFTEIGRNPGFNENFQGLIDEVFFFSSALTDSELDDIRINGIPEPSTALLGGLGLLSLLRRRR